MKSAAWFLLLTAFSVARSSVAQNVRVTGNDNVTVSGTTGNVNIRVGDTNTTYNNQYGLSQEEIQKVVANLVQQKNSLQLEQFRKLARQLLDHFGKTQRQLEALTKRL